MYTTVNFVMIGQHLAVTQGLRYHNNHTPHINLAKIEIDRLFPRKPRLKDQTSHKATGKRDVLTICNSRYMEQRDILKMVGII